MMSFLEQMKSFKFFEAVMSISAHGLMIHFKSEIK